MRTTVRIDDDLMRELNEQAHEEGVPFTKVVNRALREGMIALREARKPARPYREKVFRMGPPKVDLTKALVLAALLEDAEVREKLARRK